MHMSLEYDTMYNHESKQPSVMQRLDWILTGMWLQERRSTCDQWQWHIAKLTQRKHLDLLSTYTLLNHMRPAHTSASNIQSTTTMSRLIGTGYKRLAEITRCPPELLGMQHYCKMKENSGSHMKRYHKIGRGVVHSMHTHHEDAAVTQRRKNYSSFCSCPLILLLTTAA